MKSNTIPAVHTGSRLIQPAKSNAFRSLAVGVGIAFFLSGCCKDKDKKAMQELVDRAIERNFKACESLQNPDHIAACISNAQNQQTALVTALAAYMTACATGDTELIKEALRNLRDLLKPSSNAILGYDGVVVNTEMVLGKEESVCFSIFLSTDGTTKPQDFVVIDGVKYLPDAAGNAILSATDGQGALAITTIVGDSAEVYQVAEGSTICFNSSGMSVTGSVSGSIALATSVDDSEANYVPTDASMFISISGMEYVITLDKACKHNSMAVDATGRGVLAFRADFSTSTGDALPARLPDGAWMVLPIQRNATGTQLRIDTGNASLGGWQVFPALPNPIADFDRNAIADQADVVAFLAAWAAGNTRADVNRDGILDANDYNHFIERWNYWSQP